MRPDRLQDKERSVRLSQKGNVSLCAILDSGTTLEQADRANSDGAVPVRRHALHQISPICN